MQIKETPNSSSLSNKGIYWLTYWKPRDSASFKAVESVARADSIILLGFNLRSVAPRLLSFQALHSGPTMLRGGRDCLSMGVFPGQAETWPQLCRLFLTSHWPELGLRPVPELLTTKKMRLYIDQPGNPRTEPSSSSSEARGFTEGLVEA